MAVIFKLCNVCVYYCMEIKNDVKQIIALGVKNTTKICVMTEEFHLLCAGNE